MQVSPPVTTETVVENADATRPASTSPMRGPPHELAEPAQPDRATPATA